MIKDFTNFRKNILNRYHNDIGMAIEKFTQPNKPTVIDSYIKRYTVKLSDSTSNYSDTISESVYVRTIDEFIPKVCRFDFASRSRYYKPKESLEGIDKANSTSWSHCFKRNYGRSFNNVITDIRSSTIGTSPAVSFEIGDDSYGSKSMTILLNKEIDFDGTIVYDSPKVLKMIENKREEINNHFKYWNGVYKTMEFLKEKYAFMRFLNGNF